MRKIQDAETMELFVVTQYFPYKILSKDSVTVNFI